MPDEQKLARIRELNDRLRTTFEGGQVMMTAGIQALTETERAEVIKAVVYYNLFDQDPENDPYREHDFGMVVAGAVKVFWKIDYYDTKLQYASPDPSDPAVTRRVLTILLADEY